MSISCPLFIVSSEMGLTQSMMNSHRVVRKSKEKDIGEVILEQHPPPEMLEFDPQQSYIVSYGIDDQSSPKFKHKALGPIAGSDAVSFASAFKKVGEDLKYMYRRVIFVTWIGRCLRSGCN